MAKTLFIFIAFPPFDRFPESLVERHLSLEAEIFLSARRIKASPWLAVRLTGIPNDPASKTGHVFDFLDQIFDCYFKATVMGVFFAID